jgi:hypothetical protein
VSRAGGVYRLTRVSAKYRGGAVVQTNGTLRVTDSLFQSNTADDGGAVMTFGGFADLT